MLRHHLRHFVRSKESEIGEPIARPLLSLLNTFFKMRNVSKNVNLTIDSVHRCVKLMKVFSCANHHLADNNFYMVLKCVDAIEREYLDKTTSSTLKQILEKEDSRDSVLHQKEGEQGVRGLVDGDLSHES
ncbi:Exocyst complex component SEC15B [Spatholobus suberectus]|nr:Exocyst complex component SEC15B [Spatholobus suberectus]